MKLSNSLLPLLDNNLELLQFVENYIKGDAKTPELRKKLECSNQCSDRFMDKILEKAEQMRILLKVRSSLFSYLHIYFVIT